MDKVDISAIIVDDDTEAIKLLEMYLRQFPEIKVIGRSTNAVTGLKLIKEILPDLIFLDIDMPEMTGLQVAELVKAEHFQPEIVFTTAFQDYAYKALSVEPLDFLTKPFSPVDLENVVRKFIARKEKKKNKQKMDKFIQSQLNPEKLKLPTVNGTLIVDTSDIVFVKANAHQSFIHLLDGTVETLTLNLKGIVRLLDPKMFFQINRSTYLNKTYLQRIDKKKEICIVRFNNTVREEIFGKDYIAYFEGLNIFPIL